MSARSKLEYAHVDGENHRPQLTLYALSTCAFCEKAQDYLKQRSFSYDYIFLDTIDPEVKRAVKGELKENFGINAVFPILVIDEEKAITGFTESTWSSNLEV